MLQTIRHWSVIFFGSLVALATGCQRPSTPSAAPTSTDLAPVVVPATTKKSPALPAQATKPAPTASASRTGPDDEKRSPDPMVPPGAPIPGVAAAQPPWRVGMQAKILQGHQGAVHRVMFTPDGQSIVSGSGATVDQTVRVWSVDRGIELHRFEQRHGLSASVAVSADGSTILTRGTDNAITLWNAATGKPGGNLDPEAKIESTNSRAHVVMVEMGPPGYGVRMWDLAQRKLVGRLDDMMSQPTMHPTRNLVIGAGTESIQFWDLATGRAIGKLNMVGPFAITPDGGCILARPFTDRHVLTLASLDTATALAAFPESPAAIRCVAMAGDGKHALAGASDGVIRVLDIADARAKKRSPQPGKELKQLIGHVGPVLCVAFSPDGKRAVSGGEDKSIRVWDLETGTQIQCFGGFDEWIEWEIITWEYKYVLVQGFTDHSIQIWDHRTKRLLHTLKGHTRRILTMAHSEQSRLVASAGLDESIRIWDAGTGQEKQILRGHTGAIRRVNFNSTGKQLVSASVDGTVRTWDVESGKQLRQFEGHKGRIHSGVSFNGTVLYAGRDEWANPVLCAVFSPNDRLVVSGGADGQIILWDATTGAITRRIAPDSWGNPYQIADWPPLAGPVTFVSISPDHKHIWAVATIKNGFLDTATGLQLGNNSPWTSPWAISVGEQMELRYPHIVSESYTGVSTGSSSTITSVRTYTRTVRSGRR